MAEGLGSGTSMGPTGRGEDLSRGAPSVQGSVGSRGSLLAPRSAKQVSFCGSCTHVAKWQIRVHSVAVFRGDKHLCATWHAAEMCHPAWFVLIRATATEMGAYGDGYRSA